MFIEEKSFKMSPTKFQPFCWNRNMLDKKYRRKTSIKLKTLQKSPPEFRSLSDVEAAIFQQNKVNTLAADALAHCVTTSSAAIALTV